MVVHFEGSTDLLCGPPPLTQSWATPAWNSTNVQRPIDKSLFFNEKLIPFTWKEITGVRGSVKRHLPREGSGSDEGETVDPVESGFKAKQSSTATLDSPTPWKKGRAAGSGFSPCIYFWPLDGTNVYTKCHMRRDFSYMCTVFHFFMKTNHYF